ncbi:BREX-1 system adenine-specific DNA-methyltransferase PglX [Bacteroides uniformis]|uniref:BREX-1 system adenine-specific DNA-methyltransferase PglX n=1 Tax=Bacteroides uniformis TaxID=820 RepID=UPI0022E352AE|nr:BREX-1 system adenine-specific DNA-methyltransferase PglX [Bacteroides uniformis]
MDTGKLKRFATEARNILMKGVKHRLQSLGFDLKTGQAVEMPVPVEGGAVFMNDTVSTDFYVRWMSLYNNVQSRSIKEVAEEAAYTWFNRFMAIHIMAKQGFIAPVLEYESEDVRVPAIVSEARQGRMPQMKEAVRSQLMELLDDDSKTSEQFALLIVAYCHGNPIVNKCFGAISDYTELLLPQNILLDGGFVDMINHTEFITDEQYASAELIGWLYQFYISDRKDEAFAKKGKYDADEIAPATQIFTPNWIVKYMVENTVGRIYRDNNPYCELKDSLKYLVCDKPSAEILKVDDLADLKVADLACGSGHILNECFDLLFKIYVEEGYSRRKAIEDILGKNLLGIDLDTRAKQLATFALLMKACQKDSSFLDAKVMPRVYNMPRPIAEVIPSDWSTKDAKEFLQGTIPHYMLGSNDKKTKEITDAILLMNHADTLGSIMKFDLSEATRNAIMIRTQEYEQQLANGEVVPEAIQLFIPYMHIILALTDKYAAICMNPPYMGSGRFDSVLSKYVKDNYEEGKADLFSVFMLLAIDRLMPNGKYGMINMQSWMFLSSFEKLRTRLLEENCIDNMLHLGPRTFDELSGEVVQNTAFVIANCEGKNAVGSYYRLIEGKNCTDKERIYLEALKVHTEKVYYAGVEQAKFNKIPAYSLGYWISEQVHNIFADNKPLSDSVKSCVGLQTGDNDKFIRNWHEIDNSSIGLNCANSNECNQSKKKWFPYNKGGEGKWYGGNRLVVLWYKNGQEIKAHPGCNLRNASYYFKKGITFPRIGSSNLQARIAIQGSLFDINGPTCYHEKLEYLIGLMNSNVMQSILKVLCPSLTFQVGDVFKVPFVKKYNTVIDEYVNDNISISRQDWDAHETSWDFDRNPLYEQFLECMEDDLQNVIPSGTSLEELSKYAVPEAMHPLTTCMHNYKDKWEVNFMQLHTNEEELNRQFIEIYGLQDELTPDVPLDEITILQQGEISIENNQIKWHDDVVMKLFISYAVGCMMGRYSIDKPGLILANQGDGVNEYNEKVPNSRFEVDDDGIIPLMASDTDFSDNATLRFKQWLTVAFGDTHLVENLNFIEGALGKSLDDYFAKDFWKDHKKMYQNRPIYWLFSSKKGAFQCIAYMHRMNAYTAERIRTKYLLPHIEWLLQKQSEMEENAANLTTAERRKLDSIRKQIEECREYHDRLHVVADEQIAFDLDDGVVVNYTKFGDILAKIK